MKVAPQLALEIGSRLSTRFEGRCISTTWASPASMCVTILPCTAGRSTVNDVSFFKRPRKEEDTNRDSRTKAVGMLEEFLKHVDIPIIAYLWNTQNSVNVAAQGMTLFELPKARNKHDLEQWEPLVKWLDN